MTVFRLKASDLLKKGGFGDGDIFFDVLEDNGFDTGAQREIEDETWTHQAFDHAVLAEVVKTCLMSKLHGYELNEITSMTHNPIRLAMHRGTDEDVLAQSLAGIEVEVSEAEILAIAERLAPEFSGVRYQAAIAP